MTSSGSAGRIPCVEQPALQAFDTDGDGILSMDELRPKFPDNEQIQQVLAALESHGVSGIRYTGCGDAEQEHPSPSNGEGEDLATLIAQVALAQIYADEGR